MQFGRVVTHGGVATNGIITFNKDHIKIQPRNGLKNNSREIPYDKIVSIQNMHVVKDP